MAQLGDGFFVVFAEPLEMARFMPQLTELFTNKTTKTMELCVLLLFCFWQVLLYPLNFNLELKLAIFSWRLADLYWPGGFIISDFLSQYFSDNLKVRCLCTRHSQSTGQ